jgi:hypothetical protein
MSGEAEKTEKDVYLLGDNDLLMPAIAEGFKTDLARVKQSAKKNL